jgi:hypothetical protein
MSFNWLRRSAFLICVLSCCSYLFSQSSEGSAQRVPFCKLSRQPDKYKDSLVTLRVRVKSFRHGTSISDSSCPKQGIGLIASQSADQTTSVSHFYQFLQEHRLSKIPICATITGRLVADSDSGGETRCCFQTRIGVGLIRRRPAKQAMNFPVPGLIVYEIVRREGAGLHRMQLPPANWFAPSPGS